VWHRGEEFFVYKEFAEAENLADLVDRLAIYIIHGGEQGYEAQGHTTRFEEAYWMLNI